jgi:DNA (cytosine-5)-methyltransferase 1
MTIGSLFSGIGGLELGLESLGLGPVVWQCDSDPAARAVLAAHWQRVRRYEDVREIDERAERVEVICGGFPCQPHSFAGARRGTDDARWLWPEFARIIGCIRPRLVFIENVPGLRSSGLRNVLADLTALGFNAEWGTYGACEVGLPHSRQRLFVLAYADGHRESRLPFHAQAPGHEAADVRYRWTPPDPDALGVANGAPDRSHRMHLLGNACVPAQAAYAFESLASRIA